MSHYALRLQNLHTADYQPGSRCEMINDLIEEATAWRMEDRSATLLKAHTMCNTDSAAEMEGRQAGEDSNSQKAYFPEIKVSLLPVVDEREQETGDVVLQTQYSSIMTAQMDQAITQITLDDECVKQVANGQQVKSYLLTSTEEGSTITIKNQQDKESSTNAVV